MNHRVAVLSDVHGNYHALQAVVDHARAAGIDTFWYLGDVVDYGPDANRCLKLLMEWVDPDHWVLGNHDEALLLTYLRKKGEVQKAVAQERIETLVGGKDDLLLTLKLHFENLENFPERLDFLIHRATETRDGNIFMVHGGLTRGPTLTSIYTPLEARDNFQKLKEREKEDMPRLLLVGQTHIPAYFTATDSTCVLPFTKHELIPEICYVIEAEHCLLNPGSVGQPRDDDPRAAYMVLEPDIPVVTWYRVTYDIESTRQKIINLGMPKNFGDRLLIGR